ncbi:MULTISPECIES: DUF4189 domain-containing protein [Nocardia]|uniref:DUF4189 domain-containing protein n=2 Tax=Nocardiaceae TaxID=85025 RepID=UPI000AC7BF5E|nr:MULTISPECIES: DUF4189 domain-containing protein [Nocardia]
MIFLGSVGHDRAISDDLEGSGLSELFSEEIFRMSFMGKAGLAVAALGLAAGSVFGAGSASAAGDQWASIAVSDGQAIYGTSVNQADVESAESAAVADCYLADCQAVLTWANGCGVLVESNKALAWASGATRAEAERKAFDQLSTWTPTAVLANTGSANLSGAHVVDAICTVNAR